MNSHHKSDTVLVVLNTYVNKTTFFLGVFRSITEEMESGRHAFILEGERVWGYSEFSGTKIFRDDFLEERNILSKSASIV